LFYRVSETFIWRKGLNRDTGMDSNGKERREREENICIHIFTVSSAMVGVCLTVIGLVRVVITLGKADTFADDLLAGDALLFLVSCFASYAALRSCDAQGMRRLERFADGVFIVAMLVMVAVCAFLTYAISAPGHA
jgi:hypothetical protein